MSGNAKQDLYGFVECLRDKFEIKENQFPVDTVGICLKDKTKHLEFYEFKTHGICGTAIIGAKSDTIVLNSMRTKTEQNFDCGHEIVHCEHHNNCDTKLFNCFEKVLPEQDSFLEWQANEGSAEFEVPYRSILPKIKKSYNQFKIWSDIYEFRENLAYEFNVSATVMEVRLKSLKYEVHQYLNGCSLSNIEVLSNNQQKERGIEVKSLIDLEYELLQKNRRT